LRLRRAVFAETAPSDEVSNLLDLHRSLEAAIEAEGLTGPNAERLERIEDLLHGSIVASLSNPLIDTSYKRIRNYLKLLRLDRKISPPLALRSLREHVAVLDACRLQDAPAAVAAIQSHLAAGLQRNLGLY
jgi:DNA-binding GntR family transcriptional regulator